jgi:hypothetical protein
MKQMECHSIVSKCSMTKVQLSSAPSKDPDDENNSYLTELPSLAKETDDWEASSIAKIAVLQK